jgi:RpiR family carbohydrate utilization transcriptional regulator
VRLFQGLGYRGYQDFKIQLSQSLVPGIRSLSAEIDPADKPHTVADKVFSTSAVTLSDTRAHVDPAQLEKAVALLAEAQRIEFIGCGGSSIVALDAQHKFFKLGIFCGASPDPHNAAQVCSLLGPGDVVVAISHSGATRDVLHAARIAVDAGAALIAITGLGRSPLSRLAEVTLHTSSPESRYRSEAVASRIAQLCLIDALVVAVHLRREPAASLNLARTRRALTQKRI